MQKSNLQIEERIQQGCERQRVPLTQLELREKHSYCNTPHKVSILQDIGGNDIQKQEIKEAVELPLTHHELYRQIGIDPPRGVLLWGPPGTGKTMLAKAVAHHTTAAFIRVVGSEFVQKYLGEVRLSVNSCMPGCKKDLTFQNLTGRGA